MSRRTKLCITALFLVLLAIPGVYVCLTWHPENPLRFRLEGAYLEKDIFGDGENVVLEVTIENTSSAPICIVQGEARFTNPDAARKDLVGSLISTHALRGRALIPEHLAPKTSMRSEINFYNADENFPVGDLYVEYQWVSLPKSYLLRLCGWLHHRLPRPLAIRLPFPVVGSDEQPLQPASEPLWPPLKRTPPVEDPFAPSHDGTPQ